MNGGLTRVSCFLPSTRNTTFWIRCPVTRTSARQTPRIKSLSGGTRSRLSCPTILFRAISSPIATTTSSGTGSSATSVGSSGTVNALLK